MKVGVEQFLKGCFCASFDLEYVIAHKIQREVE